jgi:hypothetical protein
VCHGPVNISKPQWRTGPFKIDHKEEWERNKGREIKASNNDNEWKEGGEKTKRRSYGTIKPLFPLPRRAFKATDGFS